MIQLRIKISCPRNIQMIFSKIFSDNLSYRQIIPRLYTTYLYSFQIHISTRLSSFRLIPFPAIFPVFYDFFLLFLLLFISVGFSPSDREQPFFTHYCSAILAANSSKYIHLSIFSSSRFSAASLSAMT